MATKIKILAFSGSLRRDSVNHKLLSIAAQGAKDAQADVTLISLRDFPMPVYDQEIEDAQGLPEHAKRFKELMKSHHGFLIAAPEYNSSITAALKNAIDWASRKEDGEPALAAFAGKVAGLISASPGNFGGMRGLVHVRSILGNIQTLVIPEQYALSNAYEAFAEDGSAVDPKVADRAKAVARRLAEVTSRLNG